MSGVTVVVLLLLLARLACVGLLNECTDRTFEAREEDKSEFIDSFAVAKSQSIDERVPSPKPDMETKDLFAPRSDEILGRRLDERRLTGSISMLEPVDFRGKMGLGIFELETGG